MTGIPGSGKSTILPILKTSLRKKGYHVYDSREVFLRKYFSPQHSSLILAMINLLPRTMEHFFLTLFKRLFVDKIKYVASFFLQRKVLNKLILDTIFSNGELNSNSKLDLLWWMNLVSIYQFSLMHLKQDEIILLEEGFFHKLITYFIPTNNKNSAEIKIRNYINLIPEINCLIHINSNPNVCIRRLKKRNLPRKLRSKSPSEVLGYLVSADKVIRTGLTNLEANGFSQIVNIDNEHSGFNKDVFLQSFYNQYH